MEVAYLPKVRQADKVPANEQKGKKFCTCCHTEKKIIDFYISKSPLFSIDERVPICKECVINSSLNEDKSINELELNKILRKIDKPYYKDLLESAKNRFIKEHSYVNENEAKFYGKEILQAYFTLVAMRQDRDRSYEDSEKDGFIHLTSNTTKSVKQKIAKKYSDINNTNNDADEFVDTQKDIIWSDKDIQNMNYVISTLGYDPFIDIGLEESDKKYSYNILAGYCDTDGISEDGHKMQGVIEMTLLYCQCRRITEAMNLELTKKDIDDAKLQKLTSSKTALLSSIATIAKDNNIASNYNKNSKQGQSALTSKMKEMAENDFELIKVNLFDIKTAAAFKQIADLSNQSILDQLTLDNNDYVEIIKEQREMIQKFEIELDIFKEENRNLKNKIIDIENGKR
jgi:hypothetical protein